MVELSQEQTQAIHEVLARREEQKAQEILALPPLPQPPPPVLRPTFSDAAKRHVAALLMAMGQADQAICELIGEPSLTAIRDHRDFPSIVDGYERKRSDEDFALSALRGAALLNLLRLMRSFNENTALRATLQVLDRLGLHSLSDKVERIVQEQPGLRLTEEVRTIELTGVTDEERARLFDRLSGPRGQSLLRQPTSQGVDP